MEHVLDAVDDRRMVGVLADLDEALEAKQVGAAMVGEGLEKEGQGHRGDGRVAEQDEGVYGILRAGVSVAMVLMSAVTLGAGREQPLDGVEHRAPVRPPFGEQQRRGDLPAVARGDIAGGHGGF